MADFDTMVLSTEAIPVANLISAWVPINLKTEEMPTGIKNHIDKLKSKTPMSEAMESTVDIEEVMETKESEVVPKTPKKEQAVKAPAAPKTPKTDTTLIEKATSKKRMSDTVTEDNDPITLKKPRTPTGKTKFSSGGEETEAGEGNARKRNAPAGSIAPPRGIPKSWDEAEEADRLLVTMKEDGKAWDEIRKMWKEQTGQDTANSTLPNRYARVKANLSHLKEGEATKLIAAKEKVEADFAKDKWSMIADKMVENNCEKYAIEFLKKSFREIEDRQAKGLPTEQAAATASSSSATGAPIDTAPVQAAPVKATPTKTAAATKAAKTAVAKTTTKGKGKAVAKASTVTDATTVSPTTAAAEDTVFQSEVDKLVSFGGLTKAQLHGEGEGEGNDEDRVTDDEEGMVQG